MPITHRSVKETELNFHPKQYHPDTNPTDNSPPADRRPKRRSLSYRNFTGLRNNAVAVLPHKHERREQWRQTFNSHSQNTAQKYYVPHPNQESKK